MKEKKEVKEKIDEITLKKMSNVAYTMLVEDVMKKFILELLEEGFSEGEVNKIIEIYKRGVIE